MNRFVLGFKGSRAHSGSGHQHADTARRLDLLLCLLGEEARLHNHRLLRKGPLAHDLEEASLEDIDDWRLGLVVRILLPRFLWDQRPDLVNVHRGAELAVLDDVVVAHADLSDVTRVVLVKVDTVVVLTTRYRVLRGASGASRCGHGRSRRGRGATGSF